MSTVQVAEGPAAISVALEALWATSQLHPQLTPYNEAVSIRKRGPLQLDALRSAFNALTQRYDTWHSVIARVEGEPALITQAPAHFPLPLIDLSALDMAAAERHAVRIVADAARVPYDLSRGPLIRPRLVRLPDEEHRLYLAMHHAIFDGVSLARTVLPELVALYDGFCRSDDIALAPPRADYRDFARWEREWITSPRAARRLRYWRDRLNPAPPRLQMPTDEPRPSMARYRGGTIPVRVPPPLATALRETARTAGATEFQAFAAVWAALLNRLTGATDITFGTPTDLRRRSEFEPVVGYCLTPLVLRVDLSDDPVFTELMMRVRNELLDGLDHVVPFERVVREAPASPDEGGNPLYQTMFVLEPAMADHDSMWSLHQIDSALADAVGSAKVDLELQLDPRPDGSFVGQLNFDRDLFSRETTQRLLGAWHRIVEAIAVDPGLHVSELTLTDEHDTAQLAEFNATTCELAPDTVARRFGEVAARQPEAIAVTVSGLSTTYDELHRSVRDGTAWLRDVGLGEGDILAVCLDPSVRLVAATLASVDIGAAVLLLNPSDPPDVLAARLASAGCDAVIVAAGASAGFADIGVRTLEWGDQSNATPSSACSPEGASPCVFVPAPAQTGEMMPLSHTAVDALVSALIEDLDLGPRDTVLSLGGSLYDNVCSELWPTLLAGARLVLAPAELADDGAGLSTLIRAEGVTLMQATPPSWEALINTGLRPSRGLSALSGGGVLSRELADQLLERCRTLWNAYAPASPGAYCALGRVTRRGPVTVGRPLANHRMHVVDSQQRPVPVGFIGELLVSGPLVPHGGAGPERTATGQPEQGWPTGQRARWLRTGQLVLEPAPASVSSTP